MSAYPLHLDDRRGPGLLGWVELALARADLTLPLELFTEQSSVDLTPKQKRAWLLNALRSNCFASFVRVNIHAGTDFQWITDQERAWGDRVVVQGRLVAADLFGLERERERAALEEFHQFLLWVEQRLSTAGIADGKAGLQWFRSGYRDRGLEWSGLRHNQFSDEQIRHWNEELRGWCKESWFERWLGVNLHGLGRMRMGPHCWFPINSLRGGAM